MSCVIPWMAAEAETTPKREKRVGLGRKPPQRAERLRETPCAAARLPAHQFPGTPKETPADREERQEEAATAQAAVKPWMEESRYAEYERRVYRGRTVTMLRRYMRYALETGRVPSLLGAEFFRSRVTRYRMASFEDRVIFVHDMDACLARLDELSRQVLGRVVLQEYEHEEAARLWGCTRMTVHRKLLEALDKLIEILLEVGLLESFPEEAGKSCQEGEIDEFFVSDCEDGK